MAEAQQKRRFYIPLLNFGSLTPSGSAEKQAASGAEDAGALVSATEQVPVTHSAGPETLATTTVFNVTDQDNAAGDKKGVLQNCTEQVKHEEGPCNTLYIVCKPCRHSRSRT